MNAIDQPESIVRYIQRLMMSSRRSRRITRSPLVGHDGHSSNYHKVKDKEAAICDLEEHVEVLESKLQYAIAELAEAYDSLKKEVRK